MSARDPCGDPGTRASRLKEKLLPCTGVTERALPAASRIPVEGVYDGVAALVVPFRMAPRGQGPQRDGEHRLAGIPADNEAFGPHAFVSERSQAVVDWPPAPRCLFSTSGRRSLFTATLRTLPELMLTVAWLSPFSVPLAPAVQPLQIVEASRASEKVIVTLSLGSILPLCQPLSPSATPAVAPLGSRRP